MGKRHLFAVVSAIALLSVACSGGGGSSSDEPDPEADQAAVDAAIAAFEAEAEAAGFEGTPDDSDDGDDSDLTFESEECRALDEALDESDDENDEGKVASGESEDFEVTSDNGIDSALLTAQVDTYESVDAVQEDFERVFRANDVGECLVEAFEIGFADSGLPVAGLESEEIAPDIGDDAAAYRITATINADGLELPLVITMAFIRSDRAGISVMAFEFGTVDRPSLEDLSDAMLAELETIA